MLCDEAWSTGAYITVFRNYMFCQWPVSNFRLGVTIVITIQRHAKIIVGLEPYGPNYSFFFLNYYCYYFFF